MNLSKHIDKSLISLLEKRVENYSEKTVFSYLDSSLESVPEILTYQSLGASVKAIAAQLQQYQARNERVLLIYKPGLEFIAAFWGCLYAGAIAVPAYPPRKNHHFERLQNILQDADAKFVLTTDQGLTTYQQRCQDWGNLAAAHWIATDTLSTDLSSVWRTPDITAEDLALLQYTSGSTGQPKGVMIQHRHLLANFEAINQCFQDTSESSSVCWLPPYHDMGLIGGVLQTIFVGGSTYLMDPVSFLQQPKLWLESISRFQATTAGGPNFAYSLCVNSIKPEACEGLDLSHWKVAFTGAEPIRAETIRQFTDKFSPYGFNIDAFLPCYGMAETTLLVTGKRAGEAIRTLSLSADALHKNRVEPADAGQATEAVSCGQPTDDVTVEIVDPKSLGRCQPQTIGEIWVSSASVAAGYWQNQSLTEATFQARLSDQPEAGPFLRTGDLGFIENGELFITGRLKELVIVRGRNFYPQDIEEQIQASHSALRQNHGAVFSVAHQGREHLIVVQEVNRTHLRKLDPQAVLKAVRRKISEKFDLQLGGLILIKPAQIPKTTSGKIQRTLCREKFLECSFTPVYEWQEQTLLESPSPKTEPKSNANTAKLDNVTPTNVASKQANSTHLKVGMSQSYWQEAIQAWLIEKVAEHLNLAPQEIQIQTPLADYGLSSFTAVRLSGELQDWLEVPLDPTLLYDYPSIGELVVELTRLKLTGKKQDRSQPRIKRQQRRRQSDCDIAVVGIGCRFPGADSPEAYWHLLRNEVDAITEVPANRWDVDEFYDERPAIPGKMSTRWGGFVDGVENFDPNFFKISAREASSMDPQQRLLLEVTWQAFEHAGLRPQSSQANNTGVFIGISSNDYGRLNQAEFGKSDPYTGTSHALSIAANRLSYLMNWSGPSMAMDTACSSSLVSVHYASQSLRQQECNLAVAGGVNLILHPELTIAFSQAQMMANDGRCKTFDASANGYVRSEGCGIILLKRLEDAIRDQDTIYGVIKGSAVNQDGRSNGLTAPSSQAQQDVIRRALKAANLQPGDIDYIEAHGTGTALGDPIEVNAIKGVFGNSSAPHPGLRIGSVKTNLGHAESAAGIAGLIKVILSLYHEAIPASLHCKTLNPLIDLSQVPIRIQTQRSDWKTQDRPRVAGISAFGFGGTNAHMIVAEAPKVGNPKHTVFDRPWHLLTLSAKHERALAAQVSQSAQFISDRPEFDLGDLCVTANIGRSHFECRRSFLADSREDLLQQLTQAANETGVPDTSYQIPDELGACAFVFPGGQAPHRLAAQIYQNQPHFRATLDRCDLLLEPLWNRSLIDLLYHDAQGEAILEDPCFAHPASFALQYAIADLWIHWGIQPSAVMGYGLGEMVAACISGIFPLESGLKWIAQRELMRRGLDDSESVQALFVAEDQVMARLFERANTQETKIPMVFDRALKPSTSKDLFATLAHPVELQTGWDGLQKLGCDTCIEIGLKRLDLSREAWVTQEAEHHWIDGFEGDRNDWHVLLNGLQTLYAQGYPIEWKHVDRPYGHLIDVFPTYPFTRQQCWFKSKVGFNSSRIALENNGDRPTDCVHPLLGRPLRLAEAPEYRFESKLSALSPSYLQDHQVAGGVIYPATAFIEMIRAAGAVLPEIEQVEIAQVAFESPLVLTVDQACTLQVKLTPQEPQGYEVKVFSMATPNGDGATHRCHARGTVTHRDHTVAQSAIALEELQQICTQPVAIADYYSHLDTLGLNYGESFQCLRALWSGDREALGHVKLSPHEAAESGDYGLHPALLDACLQVIGGAASSTDSAYLPIGAERIWIQAHTAITEGWSHARLRDTDTSNEVCADITVYDTQGLPVAIIEGLRLQAFSRGTLQRLTQSVVNPDPYFYRIDWELQPLTATGQDRALKKAETSKTPRQWLVFGDNCGFAKQLEQKLEGQGDSCIMVRPGQGYTQVEARHYQLNPAQSQDFQFLLQNLDQQGLGHIHGVIHLWGIAPQRETEPSLEDLWAAQTLGCGSVLHLTQALIECRLTPRLWIVTQGTQSVGQPEKICFEQSALWGLGGTIASEHPEFSCTRLDLDPNASPEEDSSWVQDFFEPDHEPQITYRNHQRYGARLVHANTSERAVDSLLRPQADNFDLRIEQTGLLDRLTLVSKSRRAPSPGEIEIEVYAAGLNFRDVLNALGMTTSILEDLGISRAQDIPFGGECAGRVSAIGEGVTDFQVGDPVIAANAVGSMASYVVVPATFVVRKPDTLSFAEGATIATAFLTAQYGLSQLAQIQPGDRILIHAATGGVGQAAVQLAQQAGAQVYGTASPGKWSVLEGMGIEHPLNSRTLDFAEDLIELTKGAGVDIVLNSLNGDYIPKNLETLAPQGRFIEIGKLGIWTEQQVQEVRDDVEYFPFDLLEVSTQSPQILSSLLQELMPRFASGELKPLPYQSFAIEDAVSAFRLMAQAKHVGKIVVTLHPEAESPQAKIHANSTYLITGGLGALGLQVAERLVDLGAKHLVLTSRRAPTGSTQTQINNLSDRGVKIQVQSADVADPDSAQALFNAMETTQPPLRGIIHAAGVLDDGTLQNLTWNRFEHVLAPKMAGAWNLHRLSAQSSLDFFICFSSAAALLGAPGQGNYAAANAFLDGLAQYRNRQGMSGLSLNWGPWKAGGMATQNSAHRPNLLTHQGIEAFKPDAALAAFEQVLSSSQTQLGILSVDWGRFRDRLPAGVNVPFLERVLPMLTEASTPTPVLLSQLQSLDVSERRGALMQYLQDKIAQTLNLNAADQIEPRQRFFDMGLDSLIAIELKHHIEQSLAMALPNTVLFDYPTLEALTDYLLSELNLPDVALADQNISPASSPELCSPFSIEMVSELSESEAEQLLLQELERLNY